MDELIWGCCDQNSKDTKKDYLKCAICKKAFHYDCSDIFQESDYIKPKDWLCSLCEDITTKKGNNDSKPQNRRSTKRQAISSPIEEPSNTPITRQDLRSIVDEIVQNQTKNIVMQVKKNMSETLNSELKTIKNEIKDVKASMDFLSSKYEDIIKEHKVSSEVVKELKDKTESAETTILNLNARVNQLEQEARSNNIEIQCIPESKTENLFTIVKKLGETVGSTINEDQIQRCTRVAKANR